MSELRVLSGQEVLKILGKFGFEDFAQRHIKLRRGVAGGRTQTITVPNHSEIDRGTRHAIYRHLGSYFAASFSHNRRLAEPRSPPISTGAILFFNHAP